MGIGKRKGMLGQFRDVRYGRKKSGTGTGTEGVRVGREVLEMMFDGMVFVVEDKW